MDSSDNIELIEPLAKFHTRVLSQNRITLPKETREVYSINAKDYVIVILRKLRNSEPIKRALVILRVSSQGVTPLPVELVRKLNLSKGEIIEVILLKVIHTPQILIEGIPPNIVGEVHAKGFVFLDPSLEREIMLHSFRQ
ncbi:AbrB/MazE/SpoVT family DNA-binding domain-containing protein [Thermococcus sp. 21S7]|uniref:AbrB/MazE/SpoVT family DNA-binding domain-containing protein n=1 Tax=Thermococcus sp. 21S7 TaxID=1638221 RepID=UPI00143A6DD2|nr:AbrB/MazE/SpoVT family DNA-binding domain-containing protein [Thermococcus sp. 21S7]NJE60455.1 hypothetical protein [Thermococcus sp. 21S7]